MKQIFAVVVLSLVFGNVFGQRLDSPDRIFKNLRNYVAEPAARLARCGRMDFSEHLNDVYIDLFAHSLREASGLLRERIFRMSYEQYDLLQTANR